MTYIDPANKLFGHMDRLHQLREHAQTAAPINVEIDLSNRCSLGCEWCHFAYTHTRGPLAGKRDKPANATVGGDLMPVELAHKIIDQAAELGVRSIVWTGGGEPTLHPHFDHLVEYTAQAGIPQAVYTHGGHIDENRAALLKSLMTFVYVSLDAADPVAYQKDKGVNRFDKVIDNLRLLRAAPGEATVGIGYLVTAHNWSRAGAAAIQAADVGADYIQFRPTIRYEQDDPGVPSEDTSWLDRAIPYLRGVATRRPHVELDLERFRMYRGWKGHGYKTCHWSVLQTCITPNGKVWVCVNKREHPAAEIGDLSRESFAEVWARHSAVEVTSDCRVSCRGHLANVALEQVMAEQPHPEFV